VNYFPVAEEMVKKRLDIVQGVWATHIQEDDPGLAVFFRHFSVPNSDLTVSKEQPLYKETVEISSFLIKKQLI